MRCILSLFLSVFIIGSAYSQYSFIKLWDNRFGGGGNDWITGFVSTHDGDFLLSGESDSPANGDKTEGTRGNFDYWVVKIDSSGNKEWDKRFGTSGYDASTAAKLARDGGFILGGFTGGGINGDKTEPSRGGWDYWIVKINSQGIKEWDKRFGGDSEDVLLALNTTNDGGYILAGRSNSYASGDKTEDGYGPNDYWMVKTDSLGNLEWEKTLGGNGRDDPRSVIQTMDGGYMIGGLSSSDSSGDRSQPNWDTNPNSNNRTTDYWIVKTDSAGQKQWDKAFGTIISDRLFNVLQSSDSGYLLQGKTYADIIKIDKDGNELWNRRFNVWTDPGSYGYSKITATSDGGYLFSSEAQDFEDTSIIGFKSERNLGGVQSWILKLDSIGNKQWDKTIFSLGGDYGGYAVQTPDGCYAVANSTRAGIGGYQTHPNRDGGRDSTHDYWVVKFCMEPFNAIEEINKEPGKVLVYPNPFSSDISIALKKEGISEATFTISNAMGQVVYHRKETNLAQGYTKNLDLSFLPNGIYFIEVSSPSNMQGGEPFREVKRVVKE